MITNNLSLIGRLTKDVEFSISANGKEVSKFDLAVERTYKNSNNEKICDFFSLTAFGSTAKFLADYTGKGDLIAVSCHLINDNYVKDNKTIYRNSIIVDEVRILQSKNQRQSTQNRGQEAYSNQAPQQPYGFSQATQSQSQQYYNGQVGGYSGGQSQYQNSSFQNNGPGGNYGNPYGYPNQYQHTVPQNQSGPIEVSEDDLPF